MLINSRKKKNVVALSDTFSLPYSIARAELALMESPWEILNKTELPNGTVFAMKNADTIRLLAKYTIDVKVGQAPIWYANAPLSQDIDNVLVNLELHQYPIALTPGLLRVIPEAQDVTMFVVSEVRRRRGMWDHPRLYGNSTLRAFAGYGNEMLTKGILPARGKKKAHPIWEHPMARIPKEAIMYTLLEGFDVNVITSRDGEFKAVYNEVLQPVQV